MLVEHLLGKYMRSACRRHLTLQQDHPQMPASPHNDTPCLLYIHIPFCEELCPYCSFNRIEFEPELASRYFDSLTKEMKLYKDAGFLFDAIYVGGGTPTVMPDKLAEIIGQANDHWAISKVSVETNPNHITPEIVSILKDAGVNRLSVGVQTFDDDMLTSIGRREKYGSGKEIRERIESIKGVFDVLNIDLMFNFPEQTHEALIADIDAVQELQPTQVTFYPLMPSTATTNKLERDIGRINTRQEKKMYQEITSRLSETYSQASAWCFSHKHGLIDEYIIDHQDYAGLGSGSIGFIGNTIYSNTFSVNKYIELLEDNQLPVVASRNCSRSESLRYNILMNLFQGSIAPSELIEEHGHHARRHLLPILSFLFATRSAVRENGRLALTDRGKYYLVVLMREFFIGVNNFREAAIAVDS
jgi:coproporphyrinogen III oxidase-like Fe-S oxidoreductase